MENKEIIQDYLKRHNAAVAALDPDSLVALTEAMLKTYEHEGMIYIFGNGGSAATASHIVGDYIKGASFGLEKRFRMMCFSDNSSAMMAIANDISYDDVFVEQLKNFIGPNDLAVGISGSGNSTNVVKALEYAKNRGVRTAALCGFSGGKIKAIADVVVHSAIQDMEIAEDIHLTVFHAVKQALIRRLQGDNQSMGDQYDARIQ